MSEMSEQASKVWQQLEDQPEMYELENSLDKVRYLLAQRGLRAPVCTYLMNTALRSTESSGLLAHLWVDVVLDIVLAMAFWLVILSVIGLGIGEALAASAVVSIVVYMFQWKWTDVYFWVGNKLAARLAGRRRVPDWLTGDRANPEETWRREETWHRRFRLTLVCLSLVEEPLCTWGVLLLVDISLRDDVLQILLTSISGATMPIPFDLPILFSLALGCALGNVVAVRIQIRGYGYTRFF